MNSTNYTQLNDQNNGYYVAQSQPQPQPPTTQFFQNQQYTNNQYSYPPQQQVYYAQPTPPPVAFSTSASVSLSATLPKFDNGDKDVLPSAILFVLGFFFYIPWIINIMFVKSKSGLAKALAIASVVLFFIGIIITIIYLIVFFVVLDKVSNGFNNSISISSGGFNNSLSLSSTGGCYNSSCY